MKLISIIKNLLLQKLKLIHLKLNLQSFFFLFDLFSFFWRKDQSNSLYVKRWRIKINGEGIYLCMWKSFWYGYLPLIYTLTNSLYVCMLKGEESRLIEKGFIYVCEVILIWISSANIYLKRKIKVSNHIFGG